MCHASEAMPISKGCHGGFIGIGRCRTRSETVSGLSVGSYDSTALMPVVCCHPQLPSQHTSTAIVDPAPLS